jgi:hypothetical protein
MSSLDASPAEEAFTAEEDLLPHLSGHSAVSLTDDELLDHLERVARAQAVPPCRVCGGQLVVVAIGGAKPTVWACPAAREPEGVYLKWEARAALRGHYNASQWNQYREENSYIGELVERFRKLRAQSSSENPESRPTAI